MACIACMWPDQPKHQRLTTIWLLYKYDYHKFLIFFFHYFFPCCQLKNTTLISHKVCVFFLNFFLCLIILITFLAQVKQAKMAWTILNHGMVSRGSSCLKNPILIFHTLYEGPLFSKWMASASSNILCIVSFKILFGVSGGSL